MKSSTGSTPDGEDAPQNESAPDSNRLIGRCLNDTYLIEGIIGEGGVGRVYRARHARISTKQFALKVLHPEHSRDSHQLARFQREAEAAASLSHPNVVGVYDVGRTKDGYSYLACELLHGKDLDALLDEKDSLDVRMAVHIGKKICEGLESAHSQNIVHRDLKPQNVFLLEGEDGTIPAFPEVKLVDFGLSRFLDHTDTKLTKTGTLMGTPAYMAPEQATGEGGDHRVDVYGVGVILFAALTGRAPFEEENLPALLVAVMTEEPPRPRKLAPQIPVALELLIQRAMAKDPADRYATMTELREALETVSLIGESIQAPADKYTAIHQYRKEADAAYELKTSRLRLVFYGVATVLIGFAFFTSALSGLEIFTGPFELSRMELTLILAGICGTVATPAVLAFRHFKRTIWSNSAKVMDVLVHLRAPIIAGLVAYGVAGIAIRFSDDVLSRLGENELFVRNPGLGWAGFTWVLPAAALVAASMSALKLKLSESTAIKGRRAWLSGVLRAFSMLSFLMIVWAGLQWRTSELAKTTPGPIAVVPDLNAEGGSEPPSIELSEEALENATIAQASDAELSAALAEGIDGLLPLSEQYPMDARVLSPLLLEFASRATGFADAMVTAKKLLLVAPEKRDSEALGLMVRRAANTPGNASDLAFDLMKNDLGSTGPDLLYRLSKSGTKVSQRAKLELSSKEVTSQMSPALRIVLELEAADSCEARIPLLARAEHLGDLRTVAFLAPLAQGTKKGCGKYKKKPCLAPCQKQTKEYLLAVQAIQKRATKTAL